MKADHVAFVVDDISKAIDWYQEHLEIDVLYQDETWGIIKIYDFKIAFVLPGKHPPHVAFEIKDKEELQTKILSNGSFKGHRDGSSSLYLKDPFGNAIEFVIYPKKKISKKNKKN